MKSIQIFTNNPAVREVYPGGVHWVEGDVRDVFTAVRDAVHIGARILSHPLSGSVKPWQSPYKTVVASTRRGKADFSSLGLIENALAAITRGVSKGTQFSQATLEDFQLIDLELTQSATGLHTDGTQ